MKLYVSEGSRFSFQERLTHKKVKNKDHAINKIINFVVPLYLSYMRNMPDMRGSCTGIAIPLKKKYI